MKDWNARTGKFVGGVYNKDTFWVVLKNAIGVFDNKGLVYKIAINNIKPERVQFVNRQIVYIDEDNYINFYTPFGRLQKKEPLGIVSKHNLTFFCNRFGDNFFCVADSFLYRISQEKSGRLKIEELISNLQKPEDISTVYEKDSDLIVTGTLREGLYVYKKNPFLTTAPLTNGESDIFYSQQLLSDSQTIFAGNGLLFKNNRYVGKISGCCNKYIYGLLKDRKGYYWYATNGYIFRSLKIGVSPDTIKTDVMGHPDIFLEDREGRVWFAADEQLIYYENGKITSVQIKNLHSSEISIIKQDFIGRYYIGTHKGLFIWEHIGDSLGKKIPELQSYDIRFVLPEKNGLTWVSTYGNGIFLITKNGVTSFPENNGRLAYVHCFIEDAKGYFWMPTNHGLLATTKRSLIEYSRDNKNLPFFYSFSTNNGLRTNEFNGGTEPPFLRLPNGDISLPSMEGLVHFNPSAINFNFSASPIFIDNILLDNTDIGDSNGFDVSNKIKNISFSISSSFWGNRENDLLEYQLIEKGYAKEHDQWLPVDELNKINLFSPSHGYYQLLIRKRKGFGTDDYVYKAINFHVLPKWYETEAFFIAILIAIIFIMLVILSLRRNYYRRANQILKKKIDVATIELKQMNNTLEKKVEERTLEIQQQQIKFKTLVEHSSVGVYIIQDDKFIYVNPRFEEILGYEPDEAIGRNPLMLFDEEQRQIVAEKLRRRMSGEVESEHYEIAARKKDGTRCQLELFGSRTIYEGKPTIIGTMLDITERTKMQIKLREAEMKFRDLVEKSLVGVYISKDRKLVYVNPRFAEMFGYSQEELTEASSVDIIVYDPDKPMVEKNIRERIEGKIEGVQYEVRCIKKDGTIIHVEVFGRVTQFEGEPAIIGTMIDITTKKMAEEQLIKEKNLSQSIINNLPGIFYIFDQNGKYLLWNKNYEIVTGYTAEEISELPAGTFIIEEDLEEVSKTIAKVFAEGYAESETTLLTKDGKELSYYYNGIVVNYNDKTCMLGVGIDISERKKAQQERELAMNALQKSEANLNTIFLNTDTIYVLLDTDFKVKAFNQRAVEYVKKELSGTLEINCNFVDYLSKNRQEQFQKNAASVMEGNHVNYEKSYLQQNGKFNWYYVRKFPILNANKSPFGMMIIISDITEKKLLEQEIMDQKTQEQKKVIRAILMGEEKERNKIGQELHDNINQILAGTKLYLSIIEHDRLGSENIIKQSMQLLDSAIEEIRALSKYKVTPAKKVDLQEMLQGLIDLFHDTTKIDTDFNYSGSAQLMDEDLKLNIYRIIQEQLNNILKHAQAKKISIMVEVGEKNIRMFVADDGKGFDVESKKKGIGVANMINRVESFNGTINIQSSPDNGCKIEINLPV